MDKDSAIAGAQVAPNKVRVLTDAIRAIGLINKDLESLAYRIRGEETPDNPVNDKSPDLAMLELMNCGPDVIHSEIDRARGLIADITGMIF